MNRRQFLKAGAASAGAMLSMTLSAGPAQGSHTTRGRRVTVYRLSTHGRRDCGACKGHGANKVFRTREAADAHRAHLACNCRVVTQQVPFGLAVAWFRDGDVFDRRSRRG